MNRSERRVIGCGIAICLFLIGSLLFVFLGGFEALVGLFDNPEKSIRRELELMRSLKINYLELYCTRNTDKRILLLKNESDVEELVLTMTDVSAEGVSSLAGIPRLRGLELYAGKNVNDAALAKLDQLPKLEELVLRNCKITNAGLVSLKNLEHLRRMTIFQDHPDLKGLSDGAVDSLESLTNLTELRLVGDWVSEQGIDRLKKSLPKCVVSRNERRLLR